jgi:hypothetical protein
MHTELDYDQQLYIAQEIKIFLNNWLWNTMFMIPR